MKLKYALVNGLRQVAQPTLHGICPNCYKDVVAKCGQQRVWHWSHVGKLECDRWWENETEWHLKWKAVFPPEWQEVVHSTPSGERHIADVKTDKGLVVEFQHSPISLVERTSREQFYRLMIWLVDGTRYTRDPAAFRALLRDPPVSERPLRWLARIEDVALLRRWAPLHCPVFIDFGTEEFFINGSALSHPAVWQLEKHPVEGLVVITPVTRASFTQRLLNGSPLKRFCIHRATQPRRLSNPSKFQRYLAWKERHRPRF
ncbi:competence protein CoiA [Ensifer adhaerens]|uniref:competence protein CoiA n=1 Tax=Ensifer adhaerens TaxID=106592 RepID=UPI001C4DFD82|nr:competence protein CoiA family protein [Ensifer adhaerens]MBW0369543.1 hypothetical protein [Ensifer adhaerens]UCM21344.1 hypothetical protein LDL63_07150 [Ensifer adhaerens]